jgi:predicted esterase
MRSLRLALAVLLALTPRSPLLAQLAGDTLRAALAQRYLQIDRVASARPLTDEQRAVLNRAFDRTTFQFFAGQYAAAIGSMDSMLRVLGSGPLDAPPPPPLGEARWISGRAPSVVRDSLLAQLARVDSSGARQQAVVAARSRVALLTDAPSPSRSVEQSVQPRAHAAAVGREVSELRAGRDPYAGRSGDWWREVQVGADRRVPVRLVVPPSVTADGAAPAPLIVALHGAGGDENMFADAYGAGVLTRLADSLGAIVISPLANGLAAPAFDTLLALVAREHRVDMRRVYVVGHSMGAGIAATLANQRGAQLAGVAMLAGGAPVTSADAPPLLFVGAALDPVIPAARVKAAAEASQAAGQSATYRELASEGHTLMVGRVLPEAVQWLWGQRR